MSLTTKFLTNNKTYSRYEKLLYRLVVKICFLLGNLVLTR